jgi:opacity protein-like surface antigen
MSTSATRHKIKFQCTLAAALSLAAVSAFAQVPKSRMLGVYGGATMGIGAAQRTCDGTISCTRTAAAGKFLGGYRMTPGLAAEINYMYFGAIERVKDNALLAGATDTASDRQVTRAVTVGVNWEVELLHHFTNHLRIGWAFSRRENDRILGNGQGVNVRTYDSSLYAGAGLSFRVNESLRLISNFDYIINGTESNYLFSAGASADF